MFVLWSSKIKKIIKEKREEKTEEQHSHTQYTHNVSYTVQVLGTKIHKIWANPFTH